MPGGVPLRRCFTPQKLLWNFWTALERRIVVDGDSLTFNHAVHPGTILTTMQSQQLFRHLRICPRAPLVVADVFHPGWNMIGFRPNIRVLEVSQKRPLPRSVPDTDPTPIGHRL